MPQISALTAATSVNPGDDLVIVQSGTTKKVDAYLLPVYAQTSAESAAGVTPTNYQYKPGDVRRYGAVGNGSTDDTTAITNALAANARVYLPLPSVSFLVSTLSIPSNKVFATESVAVKIQQASGQPSTTPVIKVSGSNVTIGDLTIQGNISTDSNEFHHAISVDSSNASASVSNVHIGHVKAINIRGDGVYIGQTVSSGTTKNVTVKSVDGNNVYRNVVSIVGGSDIQIGQVTGAAVGYHHVDIEPDGATTGSCRNIHVGQVRGRHVGIVVNNPSGSTVINENVTFDEVDLDPSYATQSTPSYTPGASIIKRGLWVRSVRSARIGSLRCSNFDGAAIWSVSGGVGIESLYIGQAVFIDCAKDDATYYSYVQCPNVTFGYLYAKTEATPGGSPMGERRIIADNNCVVLSGYFSLGSNASVVRSAEYCTLQNCVITGSGSTGTYVGINCDFLTMTNCNVSSVERLAGFADDIFINGCNIDVTVAVFNTVNRATYVASTVEAQHYPLATAARTHEQAIAFGGYFLWVDSTGDLRISGTVPTTDTDGTVVGTQS